MATVDELQTITRHLNTVKTAGQARAAIGAATTAISPAYKLAEQLPDDRERATKNELNIARGQLESWYRQIATMSGSAPYEAGWATNRHKVFTAYSVIAGIEGEASYKPVTSNASILLTSIREAPGVFGEAVGTVAKQVGKTAGNVAGGVFSGLGVTGTIGLVVVLAVVVMVITRGTVIGRVMSLVGGARA